MNFAGAEEHNSIIPSSSQSHLAEKSCKPLPTGTPALSKDEAETLLGEVSKSCLCDCVLVVVDKAGWLWDLDNDDDVVAKMNDFLQ